MKKILIALVAIFALTQCKPSPNDNPSGGTFITTAVEYGIYNDATPVYVHDIDKHQTATAKEPYRFVMQSDDQTEYMVATTASLPETLKTVVDVEIKAVGVSGFKDGVRKMELVKIDIDAKDAKKAWLWSQDESLGIVVAVPIN